MLHAAATSLPELATDVAGVRMGAIDLAVGDLVGSSMANMLIPATIDLLPPRRHVLQHVTLDHAPAACLAIALNGLPAVLLVRPETSLFWVGPGSLLLFLFDVAGTRAVLMSLGLSAIIYRAKRRFAMIEPDSFLVLAVYGAAIWMLYDHAAGR